MVCPLRQCSSTPVVFGEGFFSKEQRDNAGGSPKDLAAADFFLFARIYYIYLFTAIGLAPDGSGHFTCKPNMKLVTTSFKSGGLHEKHVVATWNVGNHLSICL